MYVGDNNDIIGIPKYLSSLSTVTEGKNPFMTVLREPLKIAFVTRTSEIFVSEAEVKNRRRHS